MDLDALLKELYENKGSDLHLKVGRPPLMRTHGLLKPTSHPPVNEDELKEALSRIMTEKLAGMFERQLEADFAYHLPGKARFRVNAFYQQGHVGVVMRLIPLKIPTVEDLDLPACLKDIALENQGMVLVTGPTGCGKSTSMASMINHINRNKPCHIVTMEDPIEFIYEDDVATINQRQLGVDTLSLDEALKHVLRQDPDIILMGEMRDAVTAQTAMHAAETGHLVFSTLHTNDAKQTIDRILDMFKDEKIHQLRDMLAQTLLAVVSQRLVRRADGNGRLAVVEILYNSPNIQQLIEAGNTNEIEKAMKAGGYYNMQTFNQHFVQLVGGGIVTTEEALANTTNESDLKLMLRGVSTGTASIEQEAKEVEKHKDDKEKTRKEKLRRMLQSNEARQEQEKEAKPKIDEKFY